VDLPPLLRRFASSALASSRETTFFSPIRHNQRVRVLLATQYPVDRYNVVKKGAIR
jgi:hypothetical protein